ncbi:unnamed protein product [Aphis gossypii]|uniref:Uncharacterized protein n=1 Tax=Aphis gossypii TaxID=80765 RepID=A0A9P0J2Q3_APHGO|nr:unnamed protein product [Aphis gossypii]
MYNYGTAMSHKNIHRKNFTRLFRGVFTYPLAFRRKSEIRKKRLFSACYARNDLKHRQKRTGPYCWVISKHNGTGRMVARVPTLCTRATIAAIVPHNRYDNYYMYIYISLCARTLRIIIYSIPIFYVSISDNIRAYPPTPYVIIIYTIHVICGLTV